MRRTSLGAAAIALASAAGAETIVVNGSFEEPVVSGFQILATVPGWFTVSGPGIEVQRSVAGTPYAGAQHIELDSNGPTRAAQDLATVAGSSYRLRLAYSPRPGVGDNRIEVVWDGTVVAVLDRSGVGNADTDWTVHEYTVTASTASARLELADRSVADSLGGYVDDVCVTATDFCETCITDVVAAPDQTICAGEEGNLDAAATTAFCSGGIEYRWLDGATPLGPWSPDPAFDLQVFAPTVFTVEARCITEPACVSSDTMTVIAEPCQLAVEFDRYGARRIDAAAVEVEWVTTSEIGSLGFVVERAAHADGPFEVVAYVAARGSGQRYTVIDRPGRIVAPVYRVVELTAAGRGDATQPFRPDAARSGVRQRAPGRVTSRDR